jgi:hypothetical protein
MDIGSALNRFKNFSKCLLGGGGQIVRICHSMISQSVLLFRLSSEIYCRVKWLSIDVSEMRTASIIRDTAVYPRRQLWTSYSPPWELEISQSVLCFATCFVVSHYFHVLWSGREAEWDLLWQTSWYEMKLFRLVLLEFKSSPVMLTHLLLAC